MRGGKVVVTGAAGFIGSTLSERLIERGHEVVGVDAFTPFYDRALKEQNLAALRSRPRFTLVEADLRTDSLSLLLRDVSAVFHLAGQPGVTESWGAAFEDFVTNNVLATQRLLEAVVAVGVGRFVYASSSSVYGNGAPLPTSESAHCRPHSPYGVTKLAGEHLVDVYRANHGLSAAALRFFTAYGPRQRPDMAWNRMIRAGLRGETITIRGDGLQTRDFTFVDDIVEANLLALDSSATGSFNVGGGASVSVLEAVETIERVLGTKLQREHVDAFKGDVTHTHADATRARVELGFVPRVSLEEGLRAQAEWIVGAGVP